MPLNNFGIVIDSIADLKTLPGNDIWRGAQPDTLAIQDLDRLGCGQILKLNTDEPDEAGWCEEAAVHLTAIPIPTLTNGPDTVMAIVSRLETLRQDGNVYVHCLHGRDRTGLIIGAWRIVHQGWTMEQVNAERARYGVYGIVEFEDVEIALVLQIIFNRIHQPVS